MNNKNHTCFTMTTLIVAFLLGFGITVAKNAAIKPVPMDAEKWWMERHEMMNERVAQGNVDLLFIGDSITHNWENAGKKVWDEYYGNRNAVNLGMAGERTQYVLWRLHNGNIKNISPKLVVLMIGTNNTAARNTPEETTAGITKIVQKLRTDLPDTKILLLGIFPRGWAPSDHCRTVNTKINTMIQKLADGENVIYADIGQKFLTPKGTITKEMMADALHPGHKGYKIWAEAIEPFVVKYVDFNEANLKPTHLRCEYRENPLGIDLESPRMSWIVNATNASDRGLRQTGYQILVASTLEMLNQDVGDLWDSGRVDSDETIQIEYSGKTLQPCQECFWKVRVWDRQGQASSWSEAATWTMGLLGTPNEEAKWIGPAPPAVPVQINPDRSEAWTPKNGELDKHDAPLPLLRREIEFSKPIRRAIISICGLGQYELFINGNKVGDHVIDPGWTDYKKSCLYSTYDVTKMIRSGENCLGVMLGNGMYHERGGRYCKFYGSYGSKKMILCLQIDFADGTTSRIVSDDVWRVAPGPIVFTSIFGGEDYDARLEQAGWKQPGFDDSTWEKATVVAGPGGRLVAQSAPPVKVIKTFKPINVTEPKPGVFVYDLGQNFSGKPTVSLHGPVGKKVKITPAEVLDENGLADQRGSGCPYYLTYTLKGKGIETWHPQFTYYGFRYLQVEGAVPEDKASANAVTLSKIEGQFTRSSSSRTGSFTCSNKLINQIHDLIDWSIGSNTQSILTDCPHREKLGWLEIVQLMGPSIMYNYDVAALYAKIAHDTTEAQNPNGLVPTIAPQYVVFGGPFVDSPPWGSAAVIVPWQLYQWYGDQRMLKENYATMKRYVDYLTGKSHNHIVALGLGDWGDFPSVEEHMGWAQLTPVSLVDTAMYYQDVKILASTAELLEKTEDSQRYESLAEKIRQAFNQAYFNPETNQYVAGMPIVPHEILNPSNRDLCASKTGRYPFTSQASLAIPLALGMVDPNRVEAVFDNLVTEVGKHEFTTAGDVGHRFLLRALAEHGQNDLAYKLHNRTTNPGYGWQISQEGTAQAEAWDGRHVASNNHCQMGHFQEWLHAEVLGIQQATESVAFEQIVVRPQIISDLRWVRGHYDSIRGKISVDWHREGNQLTLKVVVPPNTSATIYVPTTDADKVLESGKPVSEVKDLKFVGAVDGTVKYEVGSGNYVFISPVK